MDDLTPKQLLSMIRLKKNHEAFTAPSLEEQKSNDPITKEKTFLLSRQYLQEKRPWKDLYHLWEPFISKDEPTEALNQVFSLAIMMGKESELIYLCSEYRAPLLELFKQLKSALRGIFLNKIYSSAIFESFIKVLFHEKDREKLSSLEKLFIFIYMVQKKDPSSFDFFIKEEYRWLYLINNEKKDLCIDEISFWFFAAQSAFYKDDYEAARLLFKKVPQHHILFNQTKDFLRKIHYKASKSIDNTICIKLRGIKTEEEQIAFLESVFEKALYGNQSDIFIMEEICDWLKSPFKDLISSEKMWRKAAALFASAIYLKDHLITLPLCFKIAALDTSYPFSLRYGFWSYFDDPSLEQTSQAELYAVALFYKFLFDPEKNNFDLWHCEKILTKKAKDGSLVLSPSISQMIQISRPQTSKQSEKIIEASLQCVFSSQGFNALDLQHYLSLNLLLPKDKIRQFLSYLDKNHHLQISLKLYSMLASYHLTNQELIQFLGISKIGKKTDLSWRILEVLLARQNPSSTLLEVAKKQAFFKSYDHEILSPSQAEMEFCFEGFKKDEEIFIRSYLELMQEPWEIWEDDHLEVKHQNSLLAFFSKKDRGWVECLESESSFFSKNHYKIKRSSRWVEDYKTNLVQAFRGLKSSLWSEGFLYMTYAGGLFLFDWHFGLLEKKLKALEEKPLPAETQGLLKKLLIFLQKSDSEHAKSLCLLFFARLSMLYAPDSSEALKAFKEHYPDLFVLRGLEAFILSEKYGLYRKKHGLWRQRELPLSFFALF